MYSGVSITRTIPESDLFSVEEPIMDVELSGAVFAEQLTQALEKRFPGAAVVVEVVPEDSRVPTGTTVTGGYSIFSGISETESAVLESYEWVRYGKLDVTVSGNRRYGSLDVLHVNVRDPYSGEFLEHFEAYRPEGESEWKPWLHDTTSPYRKNLRRQAVDRINALELWKQEHVEAVS